MDSEIYIDVEVDDEESDQVVNQNTDDNFAGRDVIRQDEDGNAKPYVGMEFESEDAAKALYETYSRNAGFSTHVGQFSRNKPDGPIVTWEFACSREVFRKKNVECCNAMLRIERKDENTWVATKFIEDHIHPLESPNKVHYLRPRRHFAGATENTAETLDAASDAYVSMDGNHAPDEPNSGGRSVSPVVPNPPARNVAPYDPYVSMDGNHAPYKPNHRGRSVSPVVPNPPARNVAPYDPFVSMDGNHAPYEPNRRGRSVSPVVPNPPARNVGPINYTRPSNWKRTLGRDAQNLLNYFQKKQAENPGFYYAIQLDDENRMTNVFWTDARSRTAYNYFGDAVIFDTMYRPNQYQVPFAPFTGVNHHGQMVLFGCALLLDESESSFTWLFKTWLSAMNNRSPISITTDQDRAIQVAAAQVFPDTRHCICKWHILREGQERLALVYLANPSFYGELYSCINFSEKIEDFESSWLSLLDRYDLRRNDWLQAVYNARKQWAPVYFRGTFFAAISSNQGVGSFFDGYVNQQTSIPMFFKQYERALEHALEKEIQADYDTICTTPVLKTPSPMEQQAANLYTKKVFAKFQEELVETFVYTANRIDEDGLVSKYRVAKYEHDDKVYIVELNVSEMKASCSCQMFEYAGILCRHILTVFTVTNVLTLPSQYILKRWTRNAKSWVGVDEQISDPRGVEILTVRFKNLCQEAIKYAEEGSVAVETYNAAMIALRDCGKKISDLKKNVAKAAPPSSHGSGSLEEENFIKAPLPCGEMGPPLWPWQEALPHRFNLNDVGVPISDIIQPSMVGSIQPDGAHPDNTVVYTCFKSMKWVIEKKNSTSAGKVAVINLKLQDYGKNPPEETDVQFKVTRVTLEPMLRSMAYIGQQLSAPGNRVAVINLKLQDTNTTSGETEVKFQVSRNTLDSMLRSMVFIREQL